MTLLDTPTIAGKRWVYEQYDSTVQAATVIGPGGDAAVIHVPGTTLGVAASTDGNARYVLLDPYEGGKAAVAEAARNVACTGARPLGITNCLNFGNPQKPAVFFQFREACRGMAEACWALDTPVTGGNVSFYNESPLGAVDPTPVVGMVGLLDDVARARSAWFARPGDRIVLFGSSRGHLGGSAYWEYALDVVGGAPPPVDLAAERRLVDLLVALAGDGLLASAHDVSDGGLAVALVECCIGSPYAPSGLGATVDCRAIQGALAPDAVLFGEDHGRVIASCPADRLEAIRERARAHHVPVADIGMVAEPDSTLEIALTPAIFRFAVRELRQVYESAIPRRMDTP